MPYRTYTSPGGQVVNGVAYLYDATLVVGDITGNFRPAFTSDFAANINVSGLNLSVGSVAVTGGSVAISNTTPIPVSGVVVTSATFDSSSIVNAQATGNNYTLISNSLLSGISGLLRGPVAVSGVVQTNATFDSTSIVNAQTTGNNLTITSNVLLSGVSGLLSSNLNDSAWVTGQVSLTNTAPIAISGVVQTTATISSVAVTGGSINVSNTAPIAISGVVQTNATFDSTSIVNAQASGNNDTTVSNRLLSGISGLLRGPVAISGIVVTNAAITGGTFTFDPTAIVNAQVSGNILLSGISGLLSSNLSDPAWVTGQVSLSNTAPIAISGVVVTNATFDSTSIVNAQVSGNNDTTVSNRLLSGISGLLRGPVAISGVVQTSATFDSSSIVNAQASGNNDTTVSNRLLSGISGLLRGPVAISGVVQTSATFDSSSIVNAQASGNNLTTISNALLSGVSGLLTTSIVSPAWVTGQLVLTTPASTATGATNPALSGLSTSAWGVALQANTDRKAWGIQNLSTGIIRFNFSITPPSSTACHVVLRGGSSLGDGLGASFFDPKPAYTGPISVSGDFSSSGAYSIWEIRS
jgi:hypothetical protein